MVRVHHFDFISSLSWNDGLSEVYNKNKPQMKESSFLSINEKRKREHGTPEETWERYFIGEVPSQITYEKEVKK
ncbi:hypothetical protein ES703_122655 [subsurface metagenome]